MDTPLARRLVPLLPLLLAALVYGPAIPGAAPMLDDAALIIGHQHPGAIWGEWTQPSYAAAGGAPSFVWRPLVTSAWHVVGAIAGRDIEAFRLFNLGLLLVILGLMQRAAAALGASPGLAAALATVVALHPATPDVVCWASCAFDLGAAALLLAAVVAGLRGAGALWIGGAALAAMLCKETALGALPAIPALLWLGGQRPRLVAVGAAGAIFLGLHRAVVGGGLPMVLDVEVGRAWLQLIGLVHGPARAGFGHLYDATDSVWPGLTLSVVCLGLAAWRRAQRRPIALAIGLWAALLVPVAIGVVHIGLAPLRYLFTPLLLALLPLAKLPARPAHALGLALAWIAVVGPRSWDRAGDWASEPALWSAERALEPQNPYLARQDLAARWQVAPPEQRRRLLEGWAAAIDAMPRALGFYDPVKDRFTLAQAAFLSGAPDLALVQVDRYLALAGPDAPANAWCLRADALERTGGEAADIAAADARCRAR